MTRTRTAAPIAIVFAIVLSPVLVGCFGQNPLESAIEQVTGSEVELPSGTIPSDFPSEVPLIDADISFAASIGAGEGKVWNVAFTSTDPAVFDTITAQLAGAGFENRTELIPGGTGTTGFFANGTYLVNVVVTENADATGYLANYTVSSGS